MTVGPISSDPSPDHLEVYDRGWDIHGLDCERCHKAARGIFRITAHGGAGNLESQIRSLVDGLSVEDVRA